MSELEAIFAAKNITATRLDLDETAIGKTGYIDQLKVASFPRGLHYGLDSHGRQYVAAAVHRAEIGDISDGWYTKDYVLVAFKRYSEPESTLWVCENLGVSGSCTDVLEAFLGYVAEGKHKPATGPYEGPLSYTML